MGRQQEPDEQSAVSPEPCLNCICNTAGSVDRMSSEIRPRQHICLAVDDDKVKKVMKRLSIVAIMNLTDDRMVQSVVQKKIILSYRFNFYQFIKTMLAHIYKTAYEAYMQSGV